MAEQYSPMLEQYFGMKARHPEAVLLSRVGDFYEAYGEDAETIARSLSIALTSKEAGRGKRVAMAGVPHHALSQYLSRLVAQRFIVALAEQLEIPQPNKLVRRDIVRVVTPGTLIEDQLLQGSQNNFLAAVSAQGETLGLAHADVSTGVCASTAFAGEDAYDELVAELTRLAPAEVIADLPPGMRQLIAVALEECGTRVAPASLAPVDARERSQIGGFSVEESLSMHRAADALIAFLRRTGVAGLRNGDSPLQTPSFYRQQTFLQMDRNTRKNLELIKALGANPQATLLGTLDKCGSAMGTRLLTRWILAPLVDRAAIERRQRFVEALASDHAARSSLQELLRCCFDLERISQRIRLKRASPRDLASLRRTLGAIAPIRSSAPPELREIVERIGDFAAVQEQLARLLTEDPPAAVSDGNVIRPDANPELAECVALRTDARAKLVDLENRERERTGIKALKIKYSSAFGYAIEVPKSQASSVPQDYVRKQTLTSGERFSTPPLKELELSISTAQSRQLRLEERLFAELLEGLLEQVNAIDAAAQALAEIDAVSSLAQCAAERGYSKPSFCDEPAMEIRDGRHPVMERILRTQFVPNDLRLRERDHRFILLTGPNMGGKSTYLRQTALLTIMAQMGSFVPAKHARLGIVDRIFTRIGAGDDLASGQSTFYVEMAEAATILRRCTRRSLLLIDEVGRGTGTIDGLAIAQAISEFLLGLDESSPMVLFATHFHELTTLSGHWNLVADYHIAAVQNAPSREPVFSHRVLPGSSSRSFGIEVARMAGLPDSVIERAQEIAEALSGKADVEEQVPLRRRLAKTVPMERQLSFLEP